MVPKADHTIARKPILKKIDKHVDYIEENPRILRCFGRK
jgi:hypothetical protein